MGTPYSSTVYGIAASGVTDLFQITAPAGRNPVITGWEVGQSTDAGDAQDEQLRLELIFGHATTGSVGNPTGNPTATVLVPSGPPPLSTVLQMNRTVATTGAPRAVHATAFNVRAGHVWLPPPELRPVLPASNIAVLRLASAPSDPIDVSATIYFEE